MSLRSNLTPEEAAAKLKLFDAWLVTDEEESLREIFEPYLFYEYVDGKRETFCTTCRSWIPGGIRGKHKSETMCPKCRTAARLIAIGRYKQDMPSLVSHRKCIFIRNMDGALLIGAGTARRWFDRYHNLYGEIGWHPSKLYYLAPGKVQEWSRVWKDGHEVWEGETWIHEPFQPVMGCYAYDGNYHVFGIDQVYDSQFKYCQIFEYYYNGFETNLQVPEHETRFVVQYLAHYAMYPQIEMAVKLGLERAVDELICSGRKNHAILDWTARTPADFLRLSKQDARLFLRAGLFLDDRWIYHKHRDELSMEEYVALASACGGEQSQETAIECGKRCGVTIRQTIHYLNRIDGRAFFWRDYLDMAERNGLDLTERTVCMPKDLGARHDQLVELETAKEIEAEKKAYKRRYKQLRKKYEFSMSGFRIIVPTCAQEIVQEGKTLHHCVGGYAARHISGATTILFLRKERRPERSFLTIELRSDGTLVQIHGYRNESYDYNRSMKSEWAWFLDPWLGWVRAGSRRDKQGRPILKQEVKTA